LSDLTGSFTSARSACQTCRADTSSTNSKIIAGIGSRVDYSKIRAPRLGIFATYDRQVDQPWYSYLRSADQAKFRENWPPIVDWQAGAIARFQAHAPGGVKPVVVRLPSAPHLYLYQR